MLAMRCFSASMRACFDFAAARLDQDAVVLAIQLREAALRRRPPARGVGDVDAAFGDVEPVRMLGLAARGIVERLHGLFGQRAFGRREIAEFRIGGERVEAGAQAFVVEILLGGEAPTAKNASSAASRQTVHCWSPLGAAVGETPLAMSC